MNKNKNYNKLSSVGWWIGGITALILGLTIWAVLMPKPTPKVVSNPQSLVGMQNGDAPWPAELAHLRERLNEIGLPALSAEGTVLHIHQHLDIFVDGKSVAIPAGIGINQTAGFISDIHAHDDTGIIHVESPKIQNFILGQFFDIWGVEFTSQQIGGYKNQGNKSLKVFVNGTQYSGDPRQLKLEAYQEIVVAYGTDQELPNPIPATFGFPVGY